MVQNRALANENVCELNPHIQLLIFLGRTNIADNLTALCATIMDLKYMYLFCYNVISVPESGCVAALVFFNALLH